MGVHRSVQEGWDGRILDLGGFAMVSLWEDITVLKGCVVVLDGRVNHCAGDEECGISQRPDMV